MKTAFHAFMSIWSEISHAGSFVLQAAKKGSSIYTTSVTSTDDLAFDADSSLASLGLEDDIDQVTGFIKSKVKKNGKVIIQHFLDSDGDGTLTKADDMVAKTSMKQASLSIFSDISDYGHSILGIGGSIYLNGLDEAGDIAQAALGYVEAASLGSLGLWSSIQTGVSVVSHSAFSGTDPVSPGVNAGLDWVV